MSLRNHRALGVTLTGGGSELPMVKALAQGTLNIHETNIKLAQTEVFPAWLKEDYPRIAVFLGGARKRILERKGIATTTAGRIKSSPSLGGY